MAAKTEAEPRPRLLRVTFTERDWSTLTERSRARGLEVGEYVRQAAVVAARSDELPPVGSALPGGASTNAAA